MIASRDRRTDGGINATTRPHHQTGSLTDKQHGTNDTLIGVDDAKNVLHGDAFSIFYDARGGNDTLISGNGNDCMWGDADSINFLLASPGAPTGGVVTSTDTFVFAPGNGDDFVCDFRQSNHDRIDAAPGASTVLLT